MKLFDVTLSICSSLIVEANSEEEALKIAAKDFEGGKQLLIDSIDQNGFEVELNE